MNTSDKPQIPALRL